MAHVVVVLGSHKGDPEQLAASPLPALFDELCVEWAGHPFIYSAHRHARELAEACAQWATDVDLVAIIAAAGRSAQLPSAITAHMQRLNPGVMVIGVGLSSSDMTALESSLAILGVPDGTPVLCSSLGGRAGFGNAARVVLGLLAKDDQDFRTRLMEYNDLNRPFSGILEA